MSLLFAQSIAEIGIIPIIGAVIITVLLVYGMFGIKHNAPKKDKSGDE